MIKADFCIRHVKEYIDISSPNASKSKIAAYQKDIGEFVVFLNEDLKMGLQKPREDISVEINEKIISNYISYMAQNGLSYSTISRRLSSLKTYFRYLRKSFDVRTPEIDIADSLSTNNVIKSNQNQETLTQKQVKKLISGMIKNDLYLPDGSASPLSISPEVRIRREPLVLRNRAIVLLFLESGISVAELCALNIKDVNTVRNFAIIRTPDGLKDEKNNKNINPRSRTA